MNKQKIYTILETISAILPDGEAYAISVMVDAMIDIGEAEQKIIKEILLKSSMAYK